MPPRLRNIWKYKRAIGYIKNELFGNFLEKMFRQRTRLNFYTFCALIKVVGPSLEQININIRKNILVEIIIAMVLARLGIGNSLQMCG
jgi:hypothetical protein